MRNGHCHFDYFYIRFVCITCSYQFFFFFLIIQLFNSFTYLILLLFIHSTFITLFYHLTSSLFFYSHHSLFLLYTFTFHLCTYLFTWIYRIGNILGVFFPCIYVLFFLVVSLFIHSFIHFSTGTLHYISQDLHIH